MKKWLLTVTTVLLMAALALGAGVTEASAASKTGTTSDGFSYKISKDNTVEITGYKGKEKKLKFPDKIKGKKVTKIGKAAVKGNQYVKSVEVPDSVKVVEQDAFNNCKNLITVKLGKNVCKFRDSNNFDLNKAVRMNPGKKFKAFEVAPQNKTYYSRDGVLYAKSKSGDSCYLVKCPPAKKGELRIPEGTTHVNLAAFDGSQLTSLVIPATVIHVNSYYFDSPKYQSNIAEYKVDKANENFYSIEGVLFKIGKGTRYPDNGDQLYHYPQEKKDAYYCVPDGVMIIDARTFAKHKYLETVEMPGVSYVWSSAFNGCENLKKVIIPKVVLLHGGAFANCEKLTEVEWKDMREIGGSAFAGSGLKNIILPESVKTIGRGAFDCDSLQWAEIRNKDCDMDDLSHIGKANKTVIYGYADSTAEKFAKKAGQEFRVIGEERPGEDNQGTITKETIKLSQTSYTYDGKKKRPKVVVKDKFGNTILDFYYKVTYKNNKNVGAATVRIEFDKDEKYVGDIQTSFVIKPPKSKITKLTPGKNDITLQWKGVKASQISGYEIQYSTNSGFEEKNTRTVQVKRDVVKKKIKNLKSGKTYYTRIRSYKTIQREGKTERIYSKWSNKQKVKTL